jgi:hypothetical protein
LSEEQTLEDDETTARHPRVGVERFVRWGLGYLFVRPRRWFFHKLICNCYPHWLPRKDDYCGWRMPNIHWWLLYRTAFKFCKWLHYDAWRPFCDWTGGWRRSFPWPARLIKRIGDTTAGYAISGGECYHCGSPEGNQVDLSDDETGTVFKLESTWSVGTQEGTDHRFCGTTICPMCGYEAYYEDGSL